MKVLFYLTLIISVCSAADIVSNFVEVLNIQRDSLGYDLLIRNTEMDMIAQRYAESLTVTPARVIPELKVMFRYTKVNYEVYANDETEAFNETFIKIEEKQSGSSDRKHNPPQVYVPSALFIGVGLIKTDMQANSAKTGDTVNQTQVDSKNTIVEIIPKGKEKWIIGIILKDFYTNYVESYNINRSLSNQINSGFREFNINKAAQNFVNELSDSKGASPVAAGQRMLVYRIPDPNGILTQSKIMENFANEVGFPITNEWETAIAISCKRGIDKSFNLVLMVEPFFNEGLAVLNAERKTRGFPCLPPPKRENGTNIQNFLNNLKSVNLSSGNGAFNTTNQAPLSSASVTTESDVVKSDNQTTDDNSFQPQTEPDSVGASDHTREKSFERKMGLMALAEQLTDELIVVMRSKGHTTISQREEALKEFSKVKKMELLALDPNLEIFAYQATQTDALTKATAVRKAARVLVESVNKEEINPANLGVLLSGEVAFAAVQFEVGRDGIENSGDWAVIILGDGLFVNVVLKALNELDQQRTLVTFDAELMEKAQHMLWDPKLLAQSNSKQPLSPRQESLRIRSSNEDPKASSPPTSPRDTTSRSIRPPFAVKPSAVPVLKSPSTLSRQRSQLFTSAEQPMLKFAQDDPKSETRSAQQEVSSPSAAANGSSMRKSDSAVPYFESPKSPRVLQSYKTELKLPIFGSSKSNIGESSSEVENSKELKKLSGESSPTSPRGKFKFSLRELSRSKNLSSSGNLVLPEPPSTDGVTSKVMMLDESVSLEAQLALGFLKMKNSLPAGAQHVGLAFEVINNKQHNGFCRALNLVMVFPQGDQRT